MDSKPPICRLCLLTSEDAVNIWETFDESSIASILAKHFWFQVHENDGFTEWLCQQCWIQTKTFHEFYKKVERYHTDLLDNSVEKYECADPDETIDGKAAVFGPYLNLDECETELTLHTTDSQISKDDTSDCSDNQSATEEVSTNQAPIKKRKVDDHIDQPSKASENTIQTDQIREEFTMKCDICNDFEFETYPELRSHFWNVHKKKAYLTCCGRKFWVLQKILEHIQLHQSNPAALSKIAEENDRVREFFDMKCEICNDVEFETFRDAKSHYRKVHKKKGYLICCGRKFGVLQKILDHIQFHQSNLAARSQVDEENNGVREFFTMKCEICNDVEFETLLDARRHYSKVHKERGYLRCCGRKFWEQQKILDHIRFHQSNPTAHSQIEEENAQIRELFTMKCEICSDVEFKTLLDAKTHYHNAHKTKGYIMCCGKKFWKRYLVLSHMLAHINPDAFHCDQCSKSFSNKRTLKMHIDNHVPLDSRAYKCSLCPSSFAKEFMLKHHVKNKHESKTGEMLPCDKCGKKFRSKILLACHIRQVHEYSLDHVCETCARRFKTKQLLTNHVINQHSTTPQPKVQCEICGNWLKHKLALQNHLTFMHQDGSVKDLKCPSCDKKATNKKSLASHIKIVHGEKSHQCPMCDKAFNRAKNLKEHVALHTGEYLYDCPYCEKKFKSNANMYTHRKKAHFTEWSRDCSQRDGLTKTATSKVTEPDVIT